MTKFDFPEVDAAIEAVVAAKGEDFVYVDPCGISVRAYWVNPWRTASCRYSDQGGNPSCIVGHVVAALDPDTFRGVVSFESSNGSDSADMFARGFYCRNVSDGHGAPQDWVQPIFSSEVTDALRAAQSAQDSGLPWGRALEYYRAVRDGDMSRHVAIGQVAEEAALEKARLQG